jgi:spore coat polysaccharide biosynthesis protein SpsF
VIAAVVQARMNSTRLPGKVLMTAAGRTMLEHLFARLGACKTLDAVVLATSDGDGDDRIAALAEARGWFLFRGSEDDVLDRYYRTAKAFAIDTVVRITADCPLIDPDVVDLAVNIFQSAPDQFDLVTNRHPLTFPDGLDVDVIPLRALEHAWRFASTPWQREHTIPYFWEAGLRVHNFEHPDQLFWEHRWTLDYEEDFQLIRSVIEGLGRTPEMFRTAEILAFLAERPAVSALNRHHIPQRSQ